MKFNGIELKELTPEQWDGKTREMLVWCDYDDNPRLALVFGFTLKGHPIADTGNYKTENTYKRFNVFQYCAEITEENSIESIDDLKGHIERLVEDNKKLSDLLNNKSDEYEKLLAEYNLLKEKNEIRKETIEELNNHRPYKKVRRMTKRELSYWCANCRGEWAYTDMNIAYHRFDYDVKQADEPVAVDIKIRGWYESEWHEPLIED